MNPGGDGGPAGTDLVGRERELAEAVALLDRSRCLTVWGPGGIGKTTLTRALVARCTAQAGVPTRWVEMASFSTIGEAMSAVADVFHLRTGGLDATLSML